MSGFYPYCINQNSLFFPFSFHRKLQFGMANMSSGLIGFPLQDSTGSRRNNLRKYLLIRSFKEKSHITGLFTCFSIYRFYTYRITAGSIQVCEQCTIFRFNRSSFLTIRCQGVCQNFHSLHNICKFQTISFTKFKDIL